MGSTIEISWTFAVLETLAFALVGAVEGEAKEWKAFVNPRLFLYARAVLAAGAFVASQVYTTPPAYALMVMGAFAVGLGVLGYWPKVQAVGQRVMGR